MADAERVKPRTMYVEEAIQMALENRWNEAVTVNRAMLQRHGPEEDTYNRLGKALSETGHLQEALEAYEETLKLNPLNLIAQKNVRKLSALLSASDRVEAAAGGIDVDLFTEEPGKSALTVLVAPDGGVPIRVAPGDVVELEANAGALTARTTRGVVLGDVEAKISRRLLPLMQTGNRYTAAVARVEEARIEVMIREEFQSPENSRKSSFPVARGRRDEFRPYAKESLLSTRGIDFEPMDEEDNENLPGGADDEADEEMEGMQTVEGEIDEVGGIEYEDEADEDVRPEDSY